MPILPMSGPYAFNKPSIRKRTKANSNKCTSSQKIHHRLKSQILSSKVGFMKLRSATVNAIIKLQINRSSFHCQKKTQQIISPTWQRKLDYTLREVVIFFPRKYQRNSTFSRHKCLVWQWEYLSPNAEIHILSLYFLLNLQSERRQKLSCNKSSIDCECCVWWCGLVSNDNKCSEGKAFCEICLQRLSQVFWTGSSIFISHIREHISSGWDSF